MSSTELTDQFAEIEQLAHRADMEPKAASRISDAKVALMIGGLETPAAAFFSAAAMRLKWVPDWDIDTAATNGKQVKYNPDFVVGLPPKELVGVLCHEVLHVTNAHHARRGGRDMANWNVACDLAINPLIKDAGFGLPSGGLMPSAKNLPADLSAEEYYEQLPAAGEDYGGQDPGGCGGVEDPPGADGEDGPSAAEALRQAEAEAKEMAAGAAQAAKRRGELPSGLARMVESLLRPTVDWRDVLREFVRSFAKNDYSWTKCNRRYIAQGIYLPGMFSEELGDVIVAVDTSGSIDQEMLDRFGGELSGILEAYDVTVTVLYCDSEIQGEPVTWRASDGPLRLEARGGGGTSHVPVWRWIKEQNAEPTCVVCLTDLYTDFGSDPGVPVLWASTGDRGDKAPFGTTVHVR